MDAVGVEPVLDPAPRDPRPGEAEPAPEPAPEPAFRAPHLGETADAELVDALARMPRREVNVGDGYVRLVDAMPRLVEAGGLGPEAAVVQAARVSYGAGTKTAQSDEALLRYLFRNEHLTPFEMVTLKFCVRAPLFTARQWMRHRAGAFNEESARYSVISAAFYYPDAADVRAQSAANRQGSGAALDPGEAGKFLESVAEAYARGYAAYERALEAGVARETARVSLAEGRYTTFYWTVNLRNLLHFLKLRTDAAAQDNIRSYAAAIRDMLRGYCPAAMRAYDDYCAGAVCLTALEVRALRARAAPAEMTARERAEWAQKKEGLGL